MGAFGVVELEGASNCFEDGWGDAGEVAALQLGVVLHAHISQGGDLAAAQARDPPTVAGGQSRPFGGDLRAPRGEELAGLCLVVHVFDGTSRPRP